MSFGNVRNCQSGPKGMGRLTVIKLHVKRRLVKTKRTEFPYRSWLGRPRGWKDLGGIEEMSVPRMYVTHSPCGGGVHIGVEEESEKPFHFCSQCEMKLPGHEVKVSYFADPTRGFAFMGTIKS